MDALFDPEQLCERGVKSQERVTEVEPAAFEAYRNLESFTVVGLTNRAGEVLLQNDGSHGWTLPAFAVEPGADWVSVGRRGVASLTGTEITLEQPELVRRVIIRPTDESERQESRHTVVFRAMPVDGQPTSHEAALDLGWFDDVPETQNDLLAADIRRFIG